MKDSGYPWINSIPNDWDVVRVKDCFIQKKEKAKQIDPVVLSLARDGVKVRDITTNEGQLAASYFDYNPVEPGDMMINPMDLYSGANCSLSKVSGVISPAYVNLKHKENIEPRFYDYYFKYQYWSMAFFAHGKGVSYDNRWTLNNETIMKYPLVKPSYEEQIKIANYLDSKCNEIENIIKDIEHQIETLEEYRESLIAETVTNGLNSNVKTKNSGIKWVKEIPNHWNILRVKYISNVIEKGNGITKEQVYPDGDIQCVRYGEIYSKYNNQFINCVSKTKKQEITTKKYFQNGDILCAGTGELVEEIGKSIVYLGNDNCLAGGDIVVIKHKQEPRFFNYALNSQYSQAQKSYSKSKLKVVHISGFEIGNVKLAVPNIAEQKEIADYLDNKYFEIDSIILEKKKQLDTLGEYKKSLIYEYVTGKKEVA